MERVPGIDEQQRQQQAANEIIAVDPMLELAANRGDNAPFYETLQFLLAYRNAHGNYQGLGVGR